MHYPRITFIFYICCNSRSYMQIFCITFHHVLANDRSVFFLRSQISPPIEQADIFVCIGGLYKLVQQHIINAKHQQNNVLVPNNYCNYQTTPGIVEIVTSFTLHFHLHMFFYSIPQWPAFQFRFCKKENQKKCQRELIKNGKKSNRTDKKLLKITGRERDHQKTL